MLFSYTMQRTQEDPWYIVYSRTLPELGFKYWGSVVEAL